MGTFSWICRISSKDSSLAVTTRFTPRSAKILAPWTPVMVIWVLA
jgi:hypothetical protein